MGTGSMTNTCASCKHWRHDERELAHYGHRYVGSCAIGGPRQDGCSDTGPDETCDRHKERAK